MVDIIKCFYRAPVDQFYNPDLIESLQGCMQRLELKKLYKFYDLLLLSRSRIDTQLNKQLLFEDVLIEWSELNKRG